MKRTVLACTLVLAAAATLVVARNKNNDSPAGAPLIPVPKPVGFLTPEEEAKTFNLPKGFHAEVVASEPMIEHPVAGAFDADGRLWLVEMRSYMPDIHGNNENRKINRISVLEDTDGDGKMDKSTVFLDNLSLPRALGFIKDGVLVGVPPNLYLCRDTDGDGKADQQELVATDYGIGGNPEHQPNGLMPAMDNWVYSANYSKRFRMVDGKLAVDFIPELGQWGITQDDYGRLFHNTNSDQLRFAQIAPQYVNRHPNYRGVGANVQVCDSQAVFPSHDTAENRGYSKNFLRPDGTLREFTAACAPLIYRGDLFPREFYGNAFLCDASCNVVRRNVLTTAPDGTVSARNPYAGEQKEFIASTYERFRPVNLLNGPDGALYVIDMHHGLIQHTEYLTEYAERQYLGRELNKHLGTGRIFRIVPDNAQKKSPATPNLSKATTEQLIAALSSPNGWTRDTAQRLLVDRYDRNSVTPLRELAKSDKNPITRLHALWTLEGIGRANTAVVLAALADADPVVRAAGIRIGEHALSTAARTEVLPAVLNLADDASPEVRLQFILTAAKLGTPETDAAVIEAVGDNPTLAIRDAVVTGVFGREADILERLFAQPKWAKASKSRGDLVTRLSGAVIAGGNAKRVERLLDLAAAQSADAAWRQDALIEGFPPLLKTKGVIRRPIMLPAEPASLAKLPSSADLERITAIVHWPGQPGYVAPPPPTPLTTEEQARFEAGRQVYTGLCVQCHKPDGLGQEGLAPPLVDSEWALGPDSRTIRIVLHGLHGPLTVGGKVYNLDMPTLKVLDDDKIAAALTYVRREWGHTAPPVSPETVKKVREETASRTEPWTERELLQVK